MSKMNEFIKEFGDKKAFRVIDVMEFLDVSREEAEEFIELLRENVVAGSFKEQEDFKAEIDSLRWKLRRMEQKRSFWRTVGIVFIILTVLVFAMAWGLIS